MTHPLLRQLPNTLTTLRLLLAIPICLYILDGAYAVVLWIALAAGLSDGVDGWLARKLDATSRYGAIVDPLADKLMLSGAFACYAWVGLVPAWVALLVVGRDLVIVAGALAYHALFGRYAMAPTQWGKLSTLVQIVFAVALLVQQVWPQLPVLLMEALLTLTVLATLLSGIHYVVTWARRAHRARGTLPGQ